MISDSLYVFHQVLAFSLDCYDNCVNKGILFVDDLLMNC
jgi:hypothetical protein